MPISSRSFVFVLFLHLSCRMFSELPEFLVWKVLSHCYFKHLFCPFSLFSSTGIPIMMHTLYLIKLSQSSCMFCSFSLHFFLSLHFSWGVFIDLSSCFCWFFPWPCSVYWWARQGHSSFLLQRFAFLAFSDCVLLLIKIVYIWSVQRDDLIHVYTVKWLL